MPGDTVRGHVGFPFSTNEVKLIDVPEMDYLVYVVPIVPALPRFA